MAPDAAAAALEGRLADLGRRIVEARADADARAATGGGRPFPKLLLAAVVLVVAILAGGLALAARDGGGGAVVAEAPAGSEVSERTATQAQAPAAEAPVAAPVADEPAAQAPAAAPAADAPAVVADTSPAPAPSITVAAGESFWSIAEREVAAQLGRAPSDAEVTSWWSAFIAANADRLVEPGNPNLVLPGQVLVAPGGG